MMSLKNHIIQIQVKAQMKIAKQLLCFRKDETAVTSDMIAMPIIAVVGIVVVLLLGSAILPGAINATLITTTSWGSGASSMWAAVPTFAILAFFLLFVAIVLLVLKSVD